MSPPRSKVEYTDSAGVIHAFENPIPPAVLERLASFCTAGKYGTFRLEIKEGRPVEYRLEEAGRIDSTRREG